MGTFMSRKTLLLGCQSFILLSLLITQIDAQTLRIRFSEIPFSVLDKATLGIDPILSDPLGMRDPGMKDQIFEPLLDVAAPGVYTLNDFIGKAVQDVRCSRATSESTKTASNYNAYRELTNSRVSFNVGADVSFGKFRRFSIKAGMGYQQLKDDEESKRLEFFKETAGEIIQGGAQCQTHVVSVNMHTTPVFTKNFLSALQKLNVAAQDASSEDSRKIFNNFVENFGTHYQDSTYFGSTFVYEKLFASRTMSEAQSTARKNCVSNSFSQNLKMKVPFIEVNQNFKQDVAKCAGSQNEEGLFNSLKLASERILTVGTPPYSDPDEWAKMALKNPVPIEYKLEKISTLFLQDWFDNLPLNLKSGAESTETFNGTAMHEFFESLSSEYCEIMLGVPCNETWTGCGYNSNCSTHEKCFNDNSTLGFSCKKGCGYTSRCSKYEKCFNDNSTLGFSCKKGCEYTSNCSAREKCVNNNSVLGFSCKKGCGYTSNCSAREKCVNNNSDLGFSCKKGCGYTSNCSAKEKCVNDNSYLGFSCKKGCGYTSNCSSREACVNDNSDRGYSCRRRRSPALVPFLLFG
ncbi:uncharacterized protein LOC125179430 [Hyalella azteca]|uniref:Uncharacterized protein LOC125179430 n=1 Tax=Hyalella azteca TaxID=294128 RepID=A0A979FVE7_HYAAZ|nr:uncharacterized protein LOC125179430 [Hyalella azteca]